MEQVKQIPLLDDSINDAAKQKHTKQYKWRHTKIADADDEHNQQRIALCIVEKPVRNGPMYDGLQALEIIKTEEKRVLRATSIRKQNAWPSSYK